MRRTRTTVVVVGLAVLALIGGLVATARPAAAAPVSITGTVRFEATPLEGIEVRLYREPGRVVVAQRFTAADGTYSFAGLADGSYRLRFLDPAGDYQTEFWDDAGTYAAATPIDLSGTSTQVADADLAADTAIAGTVTDDFTGDPIGGVEVRLYREPGRQVAAQRFTAADGTYRFDDMAPGTYRLRFVDHDEFHDMEFWDGASTYANATDILLAPGDDITADAGLRLPSLLYVGIQATGNLDTDGVVVRLYREPGRVPVQDLTVVDGEEAVLFEDLDPGTYRVRLLDSHGLLATEFYEDAPFYSGADDITVYGLTGIEPMMAPASTAPLSLTVDADDDGVDVLPGDGICDAGGGRCTLRAAVQETNRTFATDTIQLTPGLDITLSLPGADEDDAATGDLDIRDPVVIDGNGGSVDGASLDRIIDAFAPAEITDLDLHHGAVGAAASGGAVRGEVSLYRSTVRDSSAGRGGGYSGSGTIDSTTISDNSASVAGGGIDSDWSTTTVVNSTIAGNSSPDGSAVSRTMTISRSTITANTGGAAISATTPTAIGGTIIDAPDGSACSASVASLGWNVVSDASCRLGGAGDQEGRIAHLLPLQDAGGPTETAPLADESPALDAIPVGTTGLCDASSALDQRGVTRPQGAACDAGATEGSGGPSVVPTWTVDTGADVVDAAPGDGTCDIGDGTCSLRAAVTETNASPGADAITIADGVTPTLSIAGTGDDANATGDVDLLGLVEIRGDGATIDGSGLDRVLDHPGTGGGLTVIDTTITGGVLGEVAGRGAGVRVAGAGAFIGTTITGNAITGGGDTRGAGLAFGTNTHGSIVDSTIDANTGATNGGGVSADVGSRLRVDGSTLTANTASGSGGGVYGFGQSGSTGGSAITVTASTIAGNTAGSGGGLYTTTWATTVVDDTEISGNTAASGAGLYAAALTVRDAHVEGNVASGSGGGIRASNATIERTTVTGNQALHGAGLHTGSNVTFEAGTISANVASGSGGGIYVAAYNLAVRRSTISGNSAPTGTAMRFNAGGVQLTASTVVDRNAVAPTFDGTGGLTAQGSIVSTAGALCGTNSFTSSGYNVVTSTPCGNAQPTDRFTANPLLSDLADNGGPTDTHLPAAGGAGVDHIPPGTPVLCDGSALDQRGVARPDGAGCDAGAVEGTGPAVTPLTVTVDVATDGIDKAPGDGVCATAANVCTLRAAIMETNARVTSDTIVITPGLAPAITRSGTDDDANAGDLDVSDFVTIEGNGTTLDARSVDRAIDHHSGILTVRDLNIVNGRLKVAGTSGGGIRTRGALVLEDSSISGSTSVADTTGGAVAVLPKATATIERSTLSGNHPGGVDAQGVATIRQSTLSGNSFESFTGIGSISGSTIVTTNVAIHGSVTLSGSVVQGGLAPICQYGTTVTSGGWNVASDTTCALNGSGDQQGVGDPLLEILGDNGGPTLTHLPASNSPAVDAIPIGTPGLCDGTAPMDQRGVSRPGGAACDAGAVEGFGPVAQGLTMTVDTAADEVDLVPGDDLCETASGHCSLRAAISESNVAPLLADTIQIAPGIDPVLSIAGPDETANLTGDLNIAGAVTIVGVGNRIDGSGVERTILASAGQLHLDDVVVVGGTGWSPGIRTLAPATLTDVVVTDTVASGGYYSAPIQADNDVPLTLERVTVTNNAVASGSSALFAFYADVTITDSTFDENASGTEDPAIGLHRGNVTMVGSSISDNVGDGLLVYNQVSGTITASTIAYNTDLGIQSQSPDLVVSHSTVVANPVEAGSVGLVLRSSTLDGGAGLTPGEAVLFTVDNGRVRLEGSTATSASGDAVLRRGRHGQEESGTMTVVGSILSGDGVPVCALASTATSEGWNVVGDSSCAIAGTGDLTGTAPLLGPLTDVGGRWVRLPGPGSPAIDRVPSGTVVVCDGTWATDQLGVARPQNGACDVGAVEQ